MIHIIITQPTAWNIEILRNNDIHSHITKNARKNHLETNRTNRKSTAVKMYNKLPENIVFLKTKSFQANVKDLL